MNKDIKKGELYVEAIIYVVGLLYGIYLYSAGGYFINLIPIVFIIGLMGKVIFDRPIMTTILGVVFNTFIVYQLYGLTGKLNFLSGLYVGIMLLAGEIAGQIYFSIYEKRKKTKRAKKIKIREEKITKETKFSLPLSAAVIIFSVILIHSYVNGNLIEYYNEKNNLQKYLVERYDEKAKDFKIGTPTINLSKDSRDYVFKVTDITTSANYSIALKNNGYIDDEYSITESRLNNIKRKEEIDSVLNKHIFIQSEYNNIIVIPSSNRLVIHKKIESDTEEEKIKFSQQAYTIIELLKINGLLEDTLVVEIRISDIKQNNLISTVSILSNVINGETFDELYVKDALEEVVMEVN